MVVDLVVCGLAGAGLSTFAVFGWLVSPLNVHWLLCCFPLVYVLFVFPPYGVVCGLVKLCLCLWVWWLVVVLVVVGQRLPVEFGWWGSPLGVSLISVVCFGRLCVCVCVCVCVVVCVSLACWLIHE